MVFAMLCQMCVPWLNLRHRDWPGTPGRFPESPSALTLNWDRAALEKSGWVRTTHYLFFSFFRGFFLGVFFLFVCFFVFSVDSHVLIIFFIGHMSRFYHGVKNETLLIALGRLNKPVDNLFKWTLDFFF